VTIDDLAEQLPNGFHDALLRTFSEVADDQATAGPVLAEGVSRRPRQRRAELVLDVWVGDLHSHVQADRERYSPARLDLLGLAYLTVDAADPRYPSRDLSPVRVGLCGADADPALLRQVPAGGFSGRFYVEDWNAFIHFAALDARLTWIGTN